MQVGGHNTRGVRPACGEGQRAGSEKTSTLRCDDTNLDGSSHLLPCHLKPTSASCLLDERRVIAGAAAGRPKSCEPRGVACLCDLKGLRGTGGLHSWQCAEQEGYFELV